MAATRARIDAARNLIPAATREPSVIGESLTVREREILQRLRGSQTLREIAADLHVSDNTVKTITSSVYRKLGAHSRSEAVTITQQDSAFQPAQLLTACTAASRPRRQRRVVGPLP